MKAFKSILLICIALLAISACTKDDIFDKLPVGTYTSNEHLIILGSDGNFKLENYPNVNDSRNFIIEGTFRGYFLKHLKLSEHPLKYKNLKKKINHSEIKI